MGPFESAFRWRLTEDEIFPTAGLAHCGIRDGVYISGHYARTYDGTRERGQGEQGDNREQETHVGSSWFKVCGET